MTKDEFKTRFSALVSKNEDLDACNTFMTEVVNDYVSHETDATTLKTLNDQITQLTDERNRLQQTNYQLFLQGLNSSSTDVNKPDIVNNPPAPTGPTPTEQINSVISQLKGEKNG